MPQYHVTVGLMDCGEAVGKFEIPSLFSAEIMKRARRPEVYGPSFLCRYLAKPPYDCQHP